MAAWEARGTGHSSELSYPPLIPSQLVVAFSVHFSVRVTFVGAKMSKSRI